MISKKTLNISDNYCNLGYSAEAGRYYEVYNGQIKEGHSCREEFEYYDFKNQPNAIGWHKTKVNLKLINDFFGIIEKKLGLKDKLVFNKTNHYDFIVISNISDFWTTNSIRRGFFTLFLRASNYYDGQNFSQCFDKYDLARKIIPAINHFLKKNINPLNIGAYSGVVESYYNKDINFLNKNLVGKNYKPKKLTVCEQVLTQKFNF